MVEDVLKVGEAETVCKAPKRTRTKASKRKDRTKRMEVLTEDTRMGMMRSFGRAGAGPIREQFYPSAVSYVNKYTNWSSFFLPGGP